MQLSSKVTRLPYFKHHKYTFTGLVRLLELVDSHSAEFLLHTSVVRFGQSIALTSIKGNEVSKSRKIDNVFIKYKP
jgi:hypothetical protein